MAGHSQFKNIMHRKGRQDAQRSKLFAKLAREITVAAKIGLPDPDMNPRLRPAIHAARAENMPKDNIERAIKKATGGDAENYEEIRYEGYGPGGVAMIVEALTDNRNRTAGDVRSVFTKRGGNLGATGAVPSCSTASASSIRAKAAEPTRCWRRRSRPAPTMSLERGRPRGLLRLRRLARGRQGARGAARRAAQVGARLASRRTPSRSTTRRPRS